MIVKPKIISDYWWYMPVLLGMLSFVIVLLCGSTTKSSWNIRNFVANCIAVCTLGHSFVGIRLCDNKKSVDNIMNQLKNDLEAQRSKDDVHGFLRRTPPCESDEPGMIN